MGISNEKLFVQDRENGIFTFENEIFKPLVLQNTLPQGSEITAFVPSSSNAYIITTLKNGVYNLFQNQLIKISSPTLELVEKYRIYDATLVDSNTIALATSYNGVYIINKKGNLIQQFNRSQGLQNNNVLSIFIDRQKNLWLGLDNGIDCIEYNSAVKRLNPSLQGASYCITIFFMLVLHLVYLVLPFKMKKILVFQKELFSQLQKQWDKFGVWQKLIIKF